MGPPRAPMRLARELGTGIEMKFDLGVNVKVRVVMAAVGNVQDAGMTLSAATLTQAAGSDLDEAVEQVYS